MQYYRNEPPLTDTSAFENFPGDSAWFKSKEKITSSTGNGIKKSVKIMVPLEYLNNFRRTLKMLLIKCEINLILTSSVNCVISNAPLNRATLFAITDTKLCVPVVTLSIQNNGKLLQQIKS